MIGEQRPKFFTLIYFGSVGMTTILKWILKNVQDRETWPGEHGSKYSGSIKRLEFLE
jgi:hypothetical protein